MKERTKGFLAGLAVALVAGVLIAATPLHKAPTDTEVFTGTSGTIVTHTLDELSYDCVVENQDSTPTNDFIVNLNGDTAQDWKLMGGKSISYTDMPITSISITADTGTPIYQIQCLELR